MQRKWLVPVILVIVFVPGGARFLFAQAAVPDSCSLLTPAQVSGVLGIPVGAGQHVIKTSTKLCGWSLAGSSTPSPKRVMLGLEVTQHFDIRKIPMQGITKVPVSGIGEDALFMTTPGIGTGLNVKKGNLAIVIRVYGFPLEQTEAKEKLLAHDILAKM